MSDRRVFHLNQAPKTYFGHVTWISPKEAPNGLFNHSVSRLNREVLSMTALQSSGVAQGGGRDWQAAPPPRDILGEHLFALIELARGKPSPIYGVSGLLFDMCFFNSDILFDEKVFGSLLFFFLWLKQLIAVKLEVQLVKVQSTNCRLLTITCDMLAHPEYPLIRKWIFTD